MLKKGERNGKLSIELLNEVYMNDCSIISKDSFQDAWKEVILTLSQHKWHMWNLVVQINKPTIMDFAFHIKMIQFCNQRNLIRPKDVAYTIFPYNLYKTIKTKGHQRNYFYNKYLHKMYPWTRTRKHSSWGTYFHRMISYHGQNQLEKIITYINNRKKIFKTPYIIYIHKIEKSETTRPRGGPCLSYVGLQIEKIEKQRVISLLCVYRNHSFEERAYGNYLGLCKLLNFICTETDSAIGHITCISSHAFVKNYKRKILDLV